MIKIWSYFWCAVWTRVACNSSIIWQVKFTFVSFVHAIFVDFVWEKDICKANSVHFLFKRVSLWAVELLLIKNSTDWIQMEPFRLLFQMSWNESSFSVCFVICCDTCVAHFPFQWNKFISLEQVINSRRVEESRSRFNLCAMFRMHCNFIHRRHINGMVKAIDGNEHRTEIPNDISILNNQSMKALVINSTHPTCIAIFTICSLKDANEWI